MGTKLGINENNSIKYGINKDGIIDCIGIYINADKTIGNSFGGIIIKNMDNSKSKY